MKKILIPVLLILFFACSKEEHIHDIIKNDDSQFFIDYNPDINHAGDGMYNYDFDYDGVNDISFTISNTGVDLKSLSDSVLISVGNFTGSGSSSLNMIEAGETIGSNVEWYPSITIAGTFQGTNYNGLIEYIGLKLTKNNIPYYGWMYLKTNFPAQPELVTKALYFSKIGGVSVEAGIILY